MAKYNKFKKSSEKKFKSKWARKFAKSSKCLKVYNRFRKTRKQYKVATIHIYRSQKKPSKKVTIKVTKKVSSKKVAKKAGSKKVTVSLRLRVKPAKRVIRIQKGRTLRRSKNRRFTQRKIKHRRFKLRRFKIRRSRRYAGFPVL